MLDTVELRINNMYSLKVRQICETLLKQEEDEDARQALQDLIYGSHLGDTAITIVLNNWLTVDEKVLATLPEKDYNYYQMLSKVEDLLNAK